MKKISVFTSTYNRGYLLGSLYGSLLKQSYKNFEWIVFDDGSTDNTKELIEGYIEQNLIDITYLKQKNGGKHRAINKCVEIAKGELFFIVDSDDYLTKDALETIVKNWDNINDKNNYCGIAGLKGYNENEIVGTSHSGFILDSTILDYRYRLKIRGDKAEAFVTEILKNNKFPEIEGENFISESIVWNRLGSKYKMRWINKIIYICKYLGDGLSAKITNLRIKNIRGTLLLYSSNLTYDIPNKYKLKNYINYYRFLFHSNLSIKQFLIRRISMLNLLGILGGIVMNVIDRYKLSKSN